MNDRDANRLEMFRTVDATLDLPAHLAVWQNQPPAIFTTQVTQFRGLLADLEATLVERQADITGRAERKRREEEELEWIAFSIGAALAVYYLTQQREDLAAEVDFPLSNWQGLRDADLIARSHLVLNRLRAALAGGSPNPNPGGGDTITVTDAPTNDPPIPATQSLADYDLTTNHADALERELQEYETLVSSPQTSRAARAALTEALKPHFAAINKHLDLMDRIILRLVPLASCQCSPAVPCTPERLTSFREKSCQVSCSSEKRWRQAMPYSNNSTIPLDQPHRLTSRKHCSHRSTQRTTKEHWRNASGTMSMS